MIYHIDGNSFYASCERVFRPDLAHTPIAILSNNDARIIAVNAECKALGFKRRDFFFEVRDAMKKKGVAVFSSNFTLYADMSARMNLIYNRLCPEVEVYSIDESFLYFPDWGNTDYCELGHEIKRTIRQETGIPVSVGIAPNKTLAKLCNKLAKKGDGVCCWSNLNQDEELGNYPVEDIWGIGKKRSAFLKRHGINTALSLKHYPLYKAKKNLTISGFNTVQELNGVRIIDKIEDEPREVVFVSRSFQKPVYDLEDIIPSLCEYTQEAVTRMRSEGLSCKNVRVYLMTNPLAEGEQYQNQMSAELPSLSAYLPEIQQVAIALMKKIYRPNYKYRKVMVGLTGLDFDEDPQLDLFDTAKNRSKELEPMMQAFDSINERYGRGTIRLASGVRKMRNEELGMRNKPWDSRREFLSPCYTTNIRDIPKAY